MSLSSIENFIQKPYFLMGRRHKKKVESESVNMPNEQKFGSIEEIKALRKIPRNKKHTAPLSKILNSKHKKWKNCFNVQEDGLIEFLRYWSFKGDFKDMSRVIRVMMRYIRVKKWKDIKTVQISYENWSLSDNEIELITKFLLPSLCDQKRLKLIFSGSKNISIHSIEKIGCYIGRHLNSLTHLTLNFDLSKIDDSSLEVLGYQLTRYLSHITHLRLHFYSCSNCTTKGMKALASYIGRCLTSLRELVLDFRWCSKVIVKDKDQLNKIFTRIPKLRSSLQIHSKDLYRW